MTEHNAIGGPSGAFGTSVSSGSSGMLRWVDGTLAHVLWGVNAIVVPFGSMGGGNTPMARPNMLSEGAPQSGCPTSLARPSHQLDPAAIAKWVACASTDEVLKYWDATASLREQTLCWEWTRGPPHSSHLSSMMRLLANEWSQAWRAQWVHNHLATSPSHPHHNVGGTPGPMALSFTAQQVSRPLPSKARPSTPARLTKTVP
jgi:hypothetical protein